MQYSVNYCVPGGRGFVFMFIKLKLVTNRLSAHRMPSSKTLHLHEPFRRVKQHNIALSIALPGPQHNNACPGFPMNPEEETSYGDTGEYPSFISYILKQIEQSYLKIYGFFIEKTFKIQLLFNINLVYAKFSHGQNFFLCMDRSQIIST